MYDMNSKYTVKKYIYIYHKYLVHTNCVCTHTPAAVAEKNARTTFLVFMLILQRGLTFTLRSDVISVYLVHKQQQWFVILP